MRYPNAAEFAGVLGDWAREGQGSLAARLALAVRSRIVAGLLPADTRLPPERQLAAALAVSRSTLVAALDRLRSEGLIESRHGSGSVVAAGVDDGSFERPTLAARVAAGRGLNLAASVPLDASHLPALGLTTDDLLAADPTPGYAPGGVPRLRSAIAARHRRLGLATEPSEIHVTAGAHAAIAVAIDAIASRGSVVIVESPTYPGLHDILGRLGVTAVSVPSGPRGPESKTLRAAAEEARRRRHRLRGVFLVHAVHSPTGRVLDEARRRTLARALDELGVPVIEDNTLADLAFGGDRPPSLAALCERVPVISVESMSKVGWGGLRVGWLRATPDLVQRATTRTSAVDLGTSVPSQLLALRLLDGYDDLARDRRRRLSLGASHLEELIRRKLPEWELTRPQGGLSTWVRLPRVDATAFGQLATRHGVTVTPGITAAPGEDAREFLRLCHDRPADYLDAAVEALADAWHAARESQRASRRLSIS